jgi:hypothetical protein
MLTTKQHAYRVCVHLDKWACNRRNGIIFGVGQISVRDKISDEEEHGGRVQSRSNKSLHDTSFSVEVRYRIEGAPQHQLLS